MQSFLQLQGGERKIKILESLRQSSAQIYIHSVAQTYAEGAEISCAKVSHI